MLFADVLEHIALLFFIDFWLWSPQNAQNPIGKKIRFIRFARSVKGLMQFYSVFFPYLTCWKPNEVQRSLAASNLNIWHLQVVIPMPTFPIGLVSSQILPDVAQSFPVCIVSFNSIVDILYGFKKDQFCQSSPNIHSKPRHWGQRIVNISWHHRGVDMIWCRHFCDFDSRLIFVHFLHDKFLSASADFCWCYVSAVKAEKARF